jgi:hypothetical protein
LRNRKNTGFFLILTYLIASIVFDIVLTPVIGRYTNSVFNSYRIFTVIEFLLITAYLRFVIVNSKVRKFILVCSVFFVVYSVFDYLNTKSDTFDSSPTGVSCLLILLFSIYFLFEKIRTPDSLFLYSTPNFWIVVSFIIFFSGTFFIYIFSKNNYNDPQFNRTFYTINSVFNIVKNLLVSVAFLIKPEQLPPKKKPLPEL